MRVRGVWIAGALLALAATRTGSAAVADITPPTITAVATTAANANGWYRTSVRVKFTCADTGGSGVAFCPPVQTIDTEGATQTVSGMARDRAGNTASASITINIDKTAPVVTGSRTPEAGANGWVRTPVTVTFDATDALSGLVAGSITPAVTYTTDRTSYSSIGKATDLAGNIGKVTITGISIDQTKPAISMTLLPAASGGGYRNASVTAHFTCRDGRSGIASCPADQILENDGANQVVAGTATDVAGNTASISKTVNIDRTAPTLVVATPANGSTVDTSSVRVTGSASDATSKLASLTINGLATSVTTAGTFSRAITLVEGANLITVIAKDRALNTTTQTVSVTYATAPPPPPPPPPSTILQMLEDPRFETGTSGFSAQDESSSVARSTEAPLEGAGSLRTSITGYGNNLWWVGNFSGGLARHFKVSGHLRSDLASSSTFQFCAMVYFADGSMDQTCAGVSGAAGDKGVVAAELTIDPAKRLESVRIRMIQEGSAPVAFTLDEAAAELDVVEMPPPSTGGGGGGGDTGGGGGGGSNACTVPASHGYPGFTYNLPAQRPFIALTQYDAVNQSTTAFSRFRNAVDSAVAGHPPYAYSPQNSVIMFRLTGNTTYIDDAIARVDAFVAEMEDSIGAGGIPAIAGDSYLEIGWYLESLSLAYDYGYDRLTPQQRQRWEALANQALFNLWHPNDAQWNGVSRPWSGWSICDPGNNYHYSFLKATMLWALATKNADLIAFLQTEKFPALVAYFAALPGGGSREGTGYGTAMRSLFENYLYWKSATGEDLSALTPHVRETIDYWVNATVPTLDRFAPIGDLSRSSLPEIFDYHENLVHTAALLSTGTPYARRGAWWVAENSLAAMEQQFNLSGEILPLPDQPLAPVSTLYHATGAGALFARSSWGDPEASWLAVVAGKYDQSHAHMDQGSFTFFRRDWLAVTPNIWSHSGIHNETEVHNTIRFARADGTTIDQSQSDTLASTMTPTVNGGLTTIATDLSNAFWRNSNLVQSWTRTFEYFGHTLRVNDSCSVAPGVTATFQLHVPVQPVLQEDGSIVAGNLVIVPLHAVNVTFTSLVSGEFSRGYRIEFRNPAGCFFNIEMRAQ